MEARGGSFCGGGTIGRMPTYFYLSRSGNTPCYAGCATSMALYAALAQRISLTVRLMRDSVPANPSVWLRAYSLWSAP